MPGHEKRFGPSAYERWRSWRRSLLVAVLIAATLASVFFALRTYGSLLLLQSARAAGTPQASSIRAWMTLPYIAERYGVPSSALRERLQLGPGTEREASLAELAQEQGMSPFAYVQRVQRAVADIPATSAIEVPEDAGWLARTSDAALAAVLAYGYPVLGLILLLGAIGLPVPTGLSTAVAGSLIGLGSMGWLWASAVAVVASVIGDLIGYALGRLASRHALQRHGRWIGYTPARQRRVQTLFERLGGITIFLTRTLVSHLSSVVNLLAGASRYALAPFLAFTLAGRLVWTTAYLGLGYVVGAELEAAADFLANLSFLLLSLGVATVMAFILWTQPRGAVP
jgi:membrane protein DedA with SNARE-associated domain